MEMKQNFALKRKLVKDKLIYVQNREAGACHIYVKQSQSWTGAGKVSHSHINYQEWLGGLWKAFLLHFSMYMTDEISCWVKKESKREGGD